MSGKQLPLPTIAVDDPPPYSEAAPADAGPDESEGDFEDDVFRSLSSSLDFFVESVLDLRPRPKQVDAVFVPEDAVATEWSLADEGDEHKGEIILAIRVKRNIKTRSGRSGQGSQSEVLDHGRKEFDGWGRYDDQRLSRPDPEALLWWEDEHLARRVAQRLYRFLNSRAPSHVRLWGEEVTFRKENEMGLWETKTGWGIIARVLIML